ncbi:MAG: hypothetical protein WBV79_16155, partial [Rhodomicrobium sp.]
MAQAAYQKSRCEKEKERFECGADARQERRLMTQQRALSEIRPMSAAGLSLPNGRSKRGESLEPHKRSAKFWPCSARSNLPLVLVERVEVSHAARFEIIAVNDG